MTLKQNLDLSTFDGQLLDGLDFCKKVYELRDQIRADPDGRANLRMRSTKQDKRVAEELVPLARYVKARYGEDRCIRVLWRSGSQPYDAVLFSSGALVDLGLVLKEMFAEIATSVHKNEYRVRELINEQRPAFGVKKTVRDKKTGVISSTAYAETSAELERDFAEQIIARIKNKADKKYPPNTVLIVDCVPNGVTFEDEWDNVIARVTAANVHEAFSEVFLIYSWGSLSATLHGAPQSVPENGS